jgi:8-oxo-dGTP diphosphatase
MKLAADIVVRCGEKFLFIRRRNEPFKGMLVLPGGFVEEDETVEYAAVRELEEETSIPVSKCDLRLIGVFSRIDRDPRGRVISIAFRCDLPQVIPGHAGSDASEIIWLPRDKAKASGLAFDHAEIVQAVE